MVELEAALDMLNTLTMKTNIYPSYLQLPNWIT